MYSTTSSINNLKKFTKLHKNTLEDFEFCAKLPDSFYNFVFKELKHLNTLKLTVSNITQKSAKQLKANESVTNLQLNFYDTTDGLHLGAKTFISHLPNVQKLTLNRLG